MRVWGLVLWNLSHTPTTPLFLCMFWWWVIKRKAVQCIYSLLYQYRHTTQTSIRGWYLYDCRTLLSYSEPYTAHRCLSINCPLSENMLKLGCSSVGSIFYDTKPPYWYRQSPLWSVTLLISSPVPLSCTHINQQQRLSLFFITPYLRSMKKDLDKI